MHSNTVRFQEEITITKVPHIVDLTKEEINEVWLNGRDFKRMRKADQVIVEQLGSFCSVVPQSARGLEGKTMTGAIERKMFVTEALSSVLNEQKRQKVKGRYDPEMIRRIYKRSSDEFVHAAELRGASDAENAEVAKEGVEAIDISRLPREAPDQPDEEILEKRMGLAAGFKLLPKFMVRATRRRRMRSDERMQ